jgi:hypothetical protein
MNTPNPSQIQTWPNSKEAPMSQSLTFGELCEALALAADLGISPKDAASLYLAAMTVQVA